MDDHEITARLRAARASDPIPPAVADRLDAVLTELIAERAATETDAATSIDSTTPSGPTDGARVTPLTARRRGASWLLAAAAVAALGFGVPAVLGNGGDDADRQTATSDPAGDQAEASRETSEGLSGDADAEPRQEPKAQDFQSNGQQSTKTGGLAGTPVRLTDLRPAEQRAVRRAVAASDQRLLNGRELDLTEDGAAKDERPTASLVICVSPEAAGAWSDGLLLMQRDGAADGDAAAEARPERRVDVYRCGADGEFALLTSVTLPPRE